MEKSLQELEELRKTNGSLKEELRLKTDQITIQINEMKELNEEKAQLTQNISDLEAKKIELQTKILRESSENKANENEETNDNQTDFLNLIKVCF